MTPARQLTLDLLPAAEPTLENFVVGANAEAVASLRAVAAGAGPQFVHLWGTAGCGRSHLLQALVPRGAAAPRVPRFDAGQRTYAVDDVEQLDAAGQAALFALQNEVRSHPSARLVTAAAAPPAGLAIRDDVRTRLAWGLVYRIEALRDDDLAHALRAHLQQRGAAHADDLIPHLLTRRTRDMRALVALLDALDAYAFALQRALTVPLLRQWEAERESGGEAGGKAEGAPEGKADGKTAQAAVRRPGGADDDGST
ncbi:MAG TPA: DnaA regulatory inactivator Hda [Burkholderiaceae bacterium]|nr:DnaA regulatory inactivator Hda [Burkholderiaceae bacterium]